MVSYLRLLQGTDRKAYRVIVRMIIAFVLLAHLGCALTLIFACTPVRLSDTLFLSKCNRSSKGVRRWFGINLETPK